MVKSYDDEPTFRCDLCGVKLITKPLPPMGQERECFFLHLFNHYQSAWGTNWCPICVEETMKTEAEIRMVLFAQTHQGKDVLREISLPHRSNYYSILKAYRTRRWSNYRHICDLVNGKCEGGDCSPLQLPCLRIQETETCPDCNLFS